MHTLPAMDSKRLLQDIGRYEVPFLMDHNSDFPVLINRAKGARVWDHDGREYIDLTSFFGVMAAGHSNPDVVNAIKTQASRLIHGMGDVHPPEIKLQFFELLNDLVSFSNFRYYTGLNGSDAVDTALKVAYAVTKKTGIIAFEGAYHGLFSGALRAAHRSDFVEPFKGIIGPQAEFFPYPTSANQADHVLDSILNRIKKGDIGALIIEPIQGRGGIVIPAEGFLKDLRDITRQHGVVFIVDEIFTGVHRTGPFLAIHDSSIEPDIICMGKALGGGVPISVTGLAPYLWEAMGVSKGEAVHTATFVSHPLSMAAGIAVMRLAKQGVLEKGSKQIHNIMQHLDIPGVFQIRGRGGFWGIELPQHCSQLDVMNILMCIKQQGVLVLPAGKDGRVIEITPPLLIERRELIFALDKVKTCIQKNC